MIHRSLSKVKGLPIPIRSLVVLPALVLAAWAIPGRSQDREAEPLDLESAVRVALASSPALEAARAVRDAGVTTARAQRPGLRPEVTATAGQTLRDPRVTLPLPAAEALYPRSASRLEVGVRQPLFQFGVGDAARKRAGALVSAAESEYRAAELDEAVRTGEAYWEHFRAQSLAGVADQGLALAEENLRVIRLLVEAGLQAEVDRLEAERGRIEAEAGVTRARTGELLARGALNRQLGRPLEQAIVRRDPGALPPLPGELAALTALALAHRPEVALLRHNTDVAEAGIHLARAARQPRLSLEASYVLQTETALQARSGVEGTVLLTAPLFNNAIHRASINEAEKGLDRLRATLKGLESGIALEIQTQRLAHIEAHSRIRLAESAIQSARAVQAITAARRELGRALQSEVLAARLSLERALGDRVQAEADLRVAAVRLNRALGQPPAGRGAGQ